MKKRKSPKPHNSRPWTPTADDALLDMWLMGRSIHNMMAILDRSEDAITSRVWKLCTGYASCRHYTPGPGRYAMLRTTLTRREHESLNWGLFGDGQKIITARPTVVDVEYMARVLNRPVDIVQAYADNRKAVQPGFGL